MRVAPRKLADSSWRRGRRLRYPPVLETLQEKQQGSIFRAKEPLASWYNPKSPAAAVTGSYCHVRREEGNTEKPSPCISGKRERVRGGGSPFHGLRIR